ncbi:MAG: DUF835 domain-containing protein [Thermoplasmata archaeon]|nr:DUF835 domain-containing protein [Thermoplasmata archaeon]
MNGDPPSRDGFPRRPSAPDEAFADAYAHGFGDGLRDGLKELLQHVSRGHTAQELRLFIESRLARVPEEVEFKRRNVLAPPPKTSWGTLARAPSAPAVAPPAPVVFGQSYLVREERPARAIEMVRQNASKRPRLVAISIHPPEFGDLPPGRLEVVRLGPSGPGGRPDDHGPAPGEIGGRVREATEAEGGALVYFDGIEFLVTEFGLETTLKFVNWLTTQASRSGSVVVASVDPRTLSDGDLHRLQRAFTSVV